VEERSNMLISSMSQVSCERVSEFALSSGELIFPRNGEGFLQIKIKNAPKVYGVFFHGENLNKFIREPQVFFGAEYGHFGVAFNLKKQAPEKAVKAFYAFAEQNWLNQEVDA